MTRALRYFRSELHAVAPAALAASLAVVLGWMYRDVVRLFVEQWRSNDMYSHGFLVPLIAAYVAWHRRTLLRGGSPAYRTGAATLLTGLAALAVGSVGGIGLLQQISIVPTLAGLVLIIGGFGALRVLWFPLAYLLAMIPLWDAVTDPLHHPSQALSAAIAQRLLQVIGVPVTRSDIFLHTPGFTLEVADACSGIHFAVAIAALILPLAYLAEVRFWRKAAVVGAALVAALLANGVRIALIGAMLHFGLTEDVHGPGHMFQGLFVAVIGYMMVLALALRLGVLPILRPSSRPSEPWSRSLGSLVPTQTGPMALALSLVVAAALFEPSVRAVDGPSGRFLPVIVEGWREIQSPSATAVRGARPDVEVTRTFRNEGIGTIHLYVGYYTRQQQGRKLIGDGLRVPATVTSVALDSGHIVGEAHDDGKAIVFWYDLNGRLTADATRARWYTVEDGLLRGRTNGALVGLTLIPAPGVDATRASREALTFAAEVLPFLRDYLSPTNAS